VTGRRRFAALGLVALAACALALAARESGALAPIER
jgi:HAMP domain-containing protein